MRDALAGGAFRESQMKRFEKLKEWFSRVRKAWTETYMKRLSTLIVYNAILWVWCSYILAWCGRYETAQMISQTAITAILGVVVTYGFKSVAENISQYGYRGKTPETPSLPIRRDDNNRDPG